MESSSSKRLKIKYEGNLSSANEIPINYAIDPGSDFRTIVKRQTFVDKTLLIRSVLMGEQIVLTTAPRRFGKSTNMDMLKKFVEIQVDETGTFIEKETSSNYAIFKDSNLLIFQDQVFFNQHFATYPVIHANFKVNDRNKFYNILDPFRSILHDTFKRHPYLLSSEKLDSNERELFKEYYDSNSYKSLIEHKVEHGLQFLSKLLYKHFDNKTVFVLIDNYDAPIINALFEKDIDIDQVIYLLDHIFSNTLKENVYVKQALLTGTFCFDSAFYGANNIIKHTFLNDHQFTQFYGFTEPEIDALINKFKIDSDTLEQVKLHYGGYVDLSNVQLFSPWSILHYLKEKELKNYWEKSGIVINLENALLFPALRYVIEKFCLGNSLEIEVLKKVELDDVIELKEICLQQAGSEAHRLYEPDLFLSFLLQQGYLTYVEEIDLDLSRYTIKVPNYEIRNDFQKKIENYYQPSVNSCLQTCATIFNKISASCEDQIFKEFTVQFEKVLSQLDFRIIKKNENTFHCIMFNVLCKTDFLIGCEYLTFTEDRPGLIFRKEHVVIIIEFGKDARTALAHSIKHNRTDFQTVKDKIYVGVFVNEDLTVAVAWLVNDTDLNVAKFWPI